MTPSIIYAVAHLATRHDLVVAVRTERLGERDGIASAAGWLEMS